MAGPGKRPLLGLWRKVFDKAKGTAMKMSTILRLPLIALGIVSTMIIAQRELDITFNDAVMDFLRNVNGIVSVFTDPIEDRLIHPVVRWLQQFRPDIELQLHWKYVFVLLWLFFGSYAKAFATRQRPIYTIILFLWSAFCALLGGILSGVAPLSSSVKIDEPIACFMLFILGISVWRATFERTKGKTWFGEFGFWGVFQLVLVVGIATISILIARKETLSIGLASLAGLIGLNGVGLLIGGLFDLDGDGDSWFQKWLNSSSATIGIDILSVLGGAAFLTSLAHA
jgi:hypothetical protein